MPYDLNLWCREENCDPKTNVIVMLLYYYIFLSIWNCVPLYIITTSEERRHIIDLILHNNAILLDSNYLFNLPIYSDKSQSNFKVLYHSPPWSLRVLI